MSDSNNLTAWQPTPSEDIATLGRAQEIVELLQRAVKLGYSITFAPEQLRLVVKLLEEATLQKQSAK